MVGKYAEKNFKIYFRKRQTGIRNKAGRNFSCKQTGSVRDIALLRAADCEILSTNEDISVRS